MTQELELERTALDDSAKAKLVEPKPMVPGLRRAPSAEPHAGWRYWRC